MNETNKELAERLFKNRAEAALSRDENSEEAKLAFKEAMEVHDRLLEQEKIDEARKEQTWNRIIKVIVEAGIPLTLFGLTWKKDWKFTKELCHFEQKDSFSNSAARANLKRVFERFKIK